MEKGEGKELKDRYHVKAYPTLNFINAEGAMVHCVVGGMNVKELLEQGNVALNGKGLAFMQREYAQGNREPEFIETYLNVLVWPIWARKTTGEPRLFCHVRSRKIE